LFVEEFLDAGYVFGDVDADGIVLDFGDADLPAIFEPAKLFELFNFLEFALRQSWIFEQGIPLKDVETKVFPVFHMDLLLSLADPGNRSAGKIKAVAFEVENRFDDIGIHNVARMANGCGDCGDLSGRFFQECGDGDIDRGWIDERFVSLNVDEDVALLVSGDFGDAFGAGAVVGAGHACFAAETADGVDNPLVIRRYHDAVDGLRLFGAFVNALDHGLAGQRDEWLTGKASGGVTRRYHNYDSWFVGSHRHILELGSKLAMLAQSEVGRGVVEFTEGANMEGERKGFPD